MPDLYVTQALPNPLGKDRPPHGGPSNAQLNGEWVEFANTSGSSYSMEGVQLVHFTFDRKCQKTGEDRLTPFNGGLDSGYSIRVHTGAGQPSWEGTVRHLYLGRSNYAWNNACGDTVVLRDATGGLIDWARYSPSPQEGRILRRVSGANDLR